ncbi:uncharacterized protein DS421_18g605980 [Arachis hypogaea]|nr:uncharacterized protein DS421_18g605980 [Arachis hypogaea]
MVNEPNGRWASGGGLPPSIPIIALHLHHVHHTFLILHLYAYQMPLLLSFSFFNQL